jgi:DNA polymerase III epsilon subunit-like protein
LRIFGLEMQKALLNAEIMVSVDIETTGFSPDKGAEIIEIGASMINTKTKKILKNFSELVKPRNGKIPNKIIELTHITNEMVRDKRFIEPVIEDLGILWVITLLFFIMPILTGTGFLNPCLKKEAFARTTT